MNLKKLISKRNKAIIRSIINYFKSLVSKEEKINVNSTYSYEIIGKGENVFSGYYDLNPIKNNKHLLHRLPKGNKFGKDSIDICYYDLSTKEIIPITTSKAWNYQQGSRLRWSNVYENSIYFNDFVNGDYVCKLFNITTKEEKIINHPLYDISLDEKYGISVNFELLHKCRPGYGYNSKGFMKKELDKDGLYLVDLESGESKLIVSFKTLVNRLDKDVLYTHYLNHISFSKDGKKVMFFHLWDANGSRHSELCIYDIELCDYFVLEDEALVSHYTWKNDEELLITCVYNDSEQYRLYDLKTKKYDILDNLSRDGHPTYVDDNTFVSDTYPLNNYQKLFMYDCTTNNTFDICRVFANPLLIDDKRCDLHPKLCNNHISIDSTLYGNRCVVVFNKKNI